jgi:hypothetical protein
MISIINEYFLFLIQLNILRVSVSDMSQHNVVRFISITKKKEGFFANFRVKGLLGGASFSSAISVDVMQTGLDLTESLEKIIEECARIAVREFEKSKFKFEISAFNI